ncbi:anti-anti-sigma factor [Tamaricihabitans halophyticus]|uniref:Anti-sigma factor antagonist n=1 Tax=Tamaricihabitans halophyticus TaxID=1262583 RepID=A0A4R2QSX2_9PSEU|nr:STAS domain-containing protein [Tamaricihabitans halophyticus]TCP50115.1 anti-anti-sigma factor [Tamaricihabitans halophyticus]
MRENLATLSSDVQVDVLSPGIHVARVSGDLDLNTASDVRACLERTLDTQGDLIVDLGGVDFLGSAGLSVLAETDARARRNQRRWALAGRHRAVLRPLRVAGLATSLPCTRMCRTHSMRSLPGSQRTVLRAVVCRPVCLVGRRWENVVVYPRQPESTGSAEHRVSGDLELAVRADPTHLSLVRSLANSLAVNQDFDLDMIADFTLAMDEICSVLIARSWPQARLVCRFDVGQDWVAVHASAPVTTTELPGPDSFDGKVLAALTDATESWLDAQGKGIGRVDGEPHEDRPRANVRFVKRKDAPP